MSQAPVSGNSVKTQSTKPLIPPDEKFWQHYSPHHEFPLSSVTSFALHFLVIASLALAVVFAPRLGCLRNKEDPIEFSPVQLGGGGGSPGGAGSERGEAAAPRPKEAVPDTERKDTEIKPQSLTKIDIPKDVDPIKLPDFRTPDGSQAIAVSNEAIQKLGSLSQEARSKIFNALTGPGQGGPGSGGGKDRGTDSGKDKRVGPGDSGKISQRQARVLRWTMIFDTQNGADYANQLHALGAILAVNNPKNPKEYLLFEDLSKRPVQGKVKDLAQIKRIYWIDDRPESVTPLAMALGIRPLPHHVVAFFPESLEQKLLKLELGYRGKKEEEILETKFRIVRAGGGYEPHVESQR
jgi:hypothetical protein